MVTPYHHEAISVLPCRGDSLDDRTWDATPAGAPRRAERRGRGHARRRALLPQPDRRAAARQRRRGRPPDPAGRERAAPSWPACGDARRVPVPLRRARREGSSGRRISFNATEAFPRRLITHMTDIHDVLI